MRKLAALGTFLIILSFTSNAFAADLTYTPDASYLTITPGTSSEVPATITLTDGGRSTYYLWFIGSVEGDIPPEWITSSKTTTFLNRWWNSSSVTYTVSVPEDADTGTYGGYIYAKAMSSHEYANEGDGIYLEVLVPSNCSAKPEFEITEFGPDLIWPPNHGIEEVYVKGMLWMPEGCTLFDVGYSIDDEYGLYSGIGYITVEADGSFTALIPVEASRLGSDKDGRLYTITFFAENEAGLVTSEGIKSLVPHDRRP